MVRRLWTKSSLNNSKTIPSTFNKQDKTFPTKMPNRPNKPTPPINETILTIIPIHYLTTISPNNKIRLITCKQ